ncbi:MAG: hypothetical protein JW856_01725 [Dehalococcoidales bacterium]|nr:hypothetical protein [Dehalococcoidales bacterium]
MKILLYGYDKTIRRVKSCLEAAGADVVMLPGGLDSVLILADGEGFSMVILDSTAFEAKKAYEHIKKQWDVPVVLIMGEDETDWSNLGSLDADGYLDKTNGDAEVIARIEAMLRRIQKSMK